MDEVFVCGPEKMIESTEAALLAAGVPANRVPSERFTSPVLEALAPQTRQAALATQRNKTNAGELALTVVLDGKEHHLQMRPDQFVLDVALAAGLDLPYSCRGGVCATCRAKVMHGEVSMEKNFGLERWETDKGFVLSCQARCAGKSLTVSYDER